MAQFNSKNKASRTSRRWYTDFDINMTLHPQTGDVSLKYDLNAVKRSIRNILSTEVYQRPFKPGLGTNLSSRLFDLWDITTATVFEQDLKDILRNLEPRAHFTDIFADMYDHELHLTMIFTILNDPRPHNLDIVLERVR